jgi:pteridine reductase
MLGERSAAEELVGGVLDRFGQVDLLVNNASAFYPTPIGSITEEDWDTLVGSNLKGPLFLCQAMAVHLAQSGGSIINMIDIHGERPLADYAVYSTAKAGLAMLTRSLARELAPEVRVNGIAPGAILWPNDASASSFAYRSGVRGSQVTSRKRYCSWRIGLRLSPAKSLRWTVGGV